MEPPLPHPRLLLLILCLITLSGTTTGRLYSYRVTQLSSRISSTSNKFIAIHPSSDNGPAEIEYKQDISRATGLAVRVIFGNRNGPIHPIVANSDEMNLCTMLENASVNVTSSQAKYKMPDSMNLRGKRCPIKRDPERRRLEDYRFPSKFTTNKDMGSGYTTFLMRVESPGSTYQRYDSVLELFAELNLTRLDGSDY